MPTRRYFANNAPQQTLNGPMLSGDTSLVISGSFSGWPSSFPFFAELDYGTASAEIISVTAITGTTATIVRGQGGTTAISHTAGATLDHVAVAQDLDEANAHASASAGVHGISGSVVGTSDAQVLSNKTLTAPAITGTISAGGATLNAQNVSLSAGITGTTGGFTAGVTGASFAANGDGTVSGVVVPKSYTTEAAATAALPTPAVGTMVYLSAPSNAQGAGLYRWNGTVWQALSTVDTGWVNMTGLVGGWTINDQPQTRQIGPVVYARGGITNASFSSAGSSVIALDPSMPMPPVTTQFLLGGLPSAALNRYGVMNPGSRAIQFGTSGGGSTSAAWYFPPVLYTIN